MGETIFLNLPNVPQLPNVAANHTNYWVSNRKFLVLWVPNQHNSFRGATHNTQTWTSLSSPAVVAVKYVILFG